MRTRFQESGWAQCTLCKLFVYGTYSHKLPEILADDKVEWNPITPAIIQEQKNKVHFMSAEMV